MQLHNKNSYLNAQHEGKAKKRVMPKVTQIIYILFILFLLIYFIYFFVSRSLYVDTDGIVEVTKQRLAATHGGKIEKLYVKRGDNFKQGDMLALIGASRFCSAPRPQVGAFKQQTNKLVFDIKDEQIQLDGLLLELSLLKQIYENKKSPDSNLRRALEINAPLLKEPLNDRMKIIEKQNDITIQKATIANLQARLQAQREAYSQAQNASVSVFERDPRCSSESIKAPFDGYVFSTSVSQSEVSNRGETILTVVAQDAPVVIEVYLENDLFDSLKPQHAYTVTFPNGKQSRAQVSELFTSAITQAEREWEDYEAIIPQLKGHLVPVDEDDMPVWKQYDRFRVKVKGVK